MMPNFLVIGAAKSGTTSLYEYLRQHPQIFLSEIKEPKFFAFENESIDFAGPGDQIAQRNVTTTLDAYQNLFRQVGSAEAVGEASVIYLYSAKACERIRHYIPETRLIAVLRNPIERAHSNYLMNVRDGRETLNFVQALEMEESRIRSNWEFIWYYTHAGFYYKQLKPYYEMFPAQRIRIYLHEDLYQTPLAVMKDLYSFLGVDDSFVPDVWVKYNRSTDLRDLKHRLRRRVSRTRFVRFIKPSLPRRVQMRLEMVFEENDKPRPEIANDLRNRLGNLFRQDILQLQDLIQKDLAHWLA